ncbi:MAG: hypothetical protein ACREHV_07135, partial [Rhizomicrobium sp.]
MPNHFHLIVVPKDEDGLVRTVGEAHRRYTNFIDTRGRRSAGIGNPAARMIRVASSAASAASGPCEPGGAHMSKGKIMHRTLLGGALSAIA